MVLLHLACCAAISLWAAQGVQHKESDDGLVRNCGATCVAIISGCVRPTSVAVAEARELVDSDGDGLASMADLLHGLESLGIVASFRHTDDQSLPPGLNILHVRSAKHSAVADHFIVSDQLAGGRFRLFCPPTGIIVGEADSLSGRWSGDYIAIHAKFQIDVVFGIVLIVTIGLVGGLLIRRYSRRIQVVDGEIG